MKISRRNFIKTSAAVSATSLAGLSSIKLAHAASQDYKAMVCLYMAGGNDAYNMVVPHSEQQYAQYQGIRTHMAIAHNELIPLGIKTDNAVDLALHPAMSSIANIIRDEGDATVLVNTGQLVEPVVGKSAFTVPDKLMSHNSQTIMAQTGSDDLSSEFGWAGRMLENNNDFVAIPPLMSLDKERKWLRNPSSIKQFVLTSNGAGKFFNLTSDKLNGLVHHMDAAYDNIFTDNYAKVMKATFHKNEELKTVLSTAPSFDGFPDTKLGSSLHTVAQLIDARNHSLMGHKRQVFFVNIGGFDTHEDQLPKHASLLEQVSDAMAAFYQEIKRQGLSEQVTTFTMSDFGRRISPNATGTDHGWAGHQIVMGGAVKGGKAYGNWPDLSIGGDFDYNNGRIKPELATDQVNASLAKWFGYNENLENLFSSLSNFQENTIDFI